MKNETPFVLHTDKSTLLKKVFRSACLILMGFPCITNTAAQTNLALNRTVKASSVLSATYAAAKAVDGRTNTQWRSKSEANPWMQVDLGAASAITRVTLTWSTYYPVAYAIQTSSDTVNWSTLINLTGQNGSIDDITSLSVTARHVRIYVTQRSSTQNGVWLSELAVVGTVPDLAAPTIPSGLTATSVTQNAFVLNWTPSTDNVSVTGYEVFRNGVLYAAVSTNTANVTGLAASTVYQLAVRARDAAGNVSPLSAVISVTTASEASSSTLLNFETFPAGVLGSNPYTDVSGYRFTGRFSANSASDPLYIQSVHSSKALMNSNWSSMVVLDRADGSNFDVVSFDHHGDPWDAPSDAVVTGYLGNGSTLTASIASGASFSTLNLNWRSLTRLVIDFNGGTNNSYGLLDNFRLSMSGSDTVGPSIPGNLKASNIGPHSLTLSWTASADNIGVVSYEVYQNGSLYASVKDTVLTVSGLTASTAYTFNVAARDLAGNTSVKSVPLTVSTASAPLTERKNSVGINLFNPGIDWGVDKPFADAMRSHRRWIRSGMTANDPEPPLDADYWPTTDAQCLVWAGLATRNNHGTYRLIFNGQAMVSASTGTLSALAYDAATNRTTGTLTITDAANADLYLTFTNTRRTPSSASNSGVTRVMLMRPVSPGSNTPHSENTLFTESFLSQIAPFTTIRSLGWVAVNWNQDSLWSDRTLMQHARQSPPAVGKAYGWEGRGASYESLILLANAAKKDVWLTVPHKVDSEYMLKLARLFKYGSDGINPYSSAQASPAYPPLDPSLKLYVEYSNEIWNDQFSQTAWVYAQSRNNVAVKFDGKTDPAIYQYLWGMRFKAVRTVEMSTAFRSVFGAEMMSRVRPVISFQKGYIDRTNQTLTFMDAYFNRRDSRSTWGDPHPVNYYLYGAGGSFYWYTDNSAVSLSNIWTNGQWDAAKRFTDAWGNPGGYYDQLSADAAWARQFGLAFLNYEGDMHPTYQGGDEAVIKQMHTGTWDIRILQNTIDHLNVLNRSDVELACFLNLNGTDGSVWAVRNAWDPSNSPQYDAVMRFNSSSPLSVDYRNAPPFLRPGASYDTREWEIPALNGTGPATITANAAYNMSYAFHTPNAGNYAFVVNYATTSAASFAVEVDGIMVSNYTPGNTSGQSVATPQMIVNCAGDKLHSVRVVALSGSITVHSISVSPASTTASSVRVSAVPADFHKGFEVTPNPGKTSVYLRFPAGSHSLEITDMTGRMVRREQLMEDRLHLDISDMRSGTYILSVISSEGKRLNRMFVKQ